jgi:hypothetical protein
VTFANNYHLSPTPLILFLLHHKDTQGKTGSLALQKMWRLDYCLGRYIRGFLGMTTPLSLIDSFSLFKKVRQSQLVNDSHLSPTPLINF